VPCRNGSLAIASGTGIAVGEIEAAERANGGLFRMTCAERTTELVEYARAQLKPERELRTHLSQCGTCRERWEREQQLTLRFQSIRSQTQALRSPEARREALIRDFSRKRALHPAEKRQRLGGRPWVWTLSAAAAVVLAVFSGHVIGLNGRNGVSPATRIRGVQTAQTIFYEASEVLSNDFLNSNLLSNDASALSSDDFIAVPYTPPLAPGEMVRMIRAVMYPETLVSMGVAVDPALAGDVPVDVVVGEDGFPRAVRITENGQF
jgi:hypothetical protein